LKAKVCLINDKARSLARLLYRFVFHTISKTEFFVQANNQHVILSIFAALSDFSWMIPSEIQTRAHSQALT